MSELGYAAKITQLPQLFLVNGTNIHINNFYANQMSTESIEHLQGKSQSMLLNRSAASDALRSLIIAQHLRGHSAFQDRELFYC